MTKINQRHVTRLRSKEHVDGTSGHDELGCTDLPSAVGNFRGQEKLTFS